LGDPGRLAVFAEKEYRQRSFLGRHPLFTFALAPLPLLVISWIAVVLPLFLVGYILSFFDAAGGNPRDYPYLTALGITLWSTLLMVIAPWATALLLCRIARQNAVNSRWPILAVGLVSIVCALFTASGSQATNDHFVADSPGNASFMVGFTLPMS